MSWASHLVQTGPNLPLPESGLEQFIQAARDWDITLELGTRGLDRDHLIRQIALAKSMGATLIRTLPEIGGQYAREARSSCRFWLRLGLCWSAKESG